MPQHVDPDDLALMALGEHPERLEDRHLGGCPQCQSDLDQLRAVVGAARSVTPDDSPTAPPPHVWDRIRDELDLAPAEAPVDLAARRAPRRTALLAAAAALVGLAVGVGSTLVATRGNDELPVLASAPLTVLATDHRGGDAEVLREGSGRVLELDVPTLKPGNGFYEVWLLGKDGKRLVSVGLLDLSAGTTARFPIPGDVDVSQFPIVDVSLEPADGNPAHSGNSIVRGTLSS